MGDELTASQAASIRRRQTIRLTVMAPVLGAAVAWMSTRRGRGRPE